MHTRSLTVRPPVWLCLLTTGLLGACYGVADPNAETAQNLNGQPLFPSDSQCSPSEMVKITSALGALRQSVVTSPTALRACMADAVLSPDRGDFAEEIVRRLGDARPTTVRCRYLRTGAEAASQLGASSEEVTVDHGLLLQGEAHIAAKILHAIAINKGYSDGIGTELAYSVGTQAEQCVERALSGAPGLWRRPRSRMRGEVELQRAGGTGGEAFESFCPASQFVTSQWTGTNATGALTGFGASCHQHGAVGGGGFVVTGQSPLEDECGLGYVAVGVHGYASPRDGNVNKIGLVCARWTEVQTGGNLVYRSARGKVSGLPFERLCPLGTALKGVLGRRRSISSTSGVLNELRPVCGSVSGVSISSPTDLTRLGLEITGATERRRVRQLCTDAGALVGLYGRSSTDLTRLGGICSAMRDSARGVFGPDDGGNPANRAWEHVLPAAGGTDGAGFSGTCAAGQVLVGLRAGAAAAETGVSHVAGVCVTAHTWARTSDNPTTSTLGAFGVDRNNGTTVLCVRGELLSGLEVTEVTRPDGVRVVESVRPLCRRIDDAPSG